MKIWLSPYHLQRKSGGQASGYLLKTESQEGVGYGDIFPWTSFGDPSFTSIPEQIKHKQFSQLVQRSLDLSLLDARARTHGEALVDELTFTNHGLVLEEPEHWISSIEKLLSDDFNKIKLKVGRNLGVEMPYLQKMQDIWPGKRWLRLDFNGQGSSFWLEKLTVLQATVDLIEDPSADPKDWIGSGWDWAFDHPGFSEDQVQYSYRVVKPAKMETPEETKPLMFTSYMDHPLGIAHAMVQAGLYGEQSMDYGLLSLGVYENTGFHEYFSVKGSYLTLKPEKGIGFTEILESQSWELING